jgi:L-threonylcarbamoyladenylate synthase
MSLDLIEIDDAAEALMTGRLVAIPTETVYGLGANATDPAAVARIYEVKNRPSNHPLIVHVNSLDATQRWVRTVPTYAHDLADAFWPGPMTLVLHRSSLAGDFVTGGQETVAVRVPAHPIARALLDAFENRGGLGVAAPSANRFGKVSPTNAAAVYQELADYLRNDDLILDGGDSAVGIESTIIDCTTETPRVLRPGAITGSMIEHVTGLTLSHNKSVIRVSGSLALHYSPRAKVLLDVVPKPGDGFIALAEHETPAGVVRLAEPRTTDEFAQLLYSSLRRADDLALDHVVVAVPTGDELSVAIIDRLQRARHR